MKVLSKREKSSFFSLTIPEHRQSYHDDVACLLALFSLLREKLTLFRAFLSVSRLCRLAMLYKKKIAFFLCSAFWSFPWEDSKSLLIFFRFFSQPKKSTSCCFGPCSTTFSVTVFPSRLGGEKFSHQWISGFDAVGRGSEIVSFIARSKTRF